MLIHSCAWGRPMFSCNRLLNLQLTITLQPVCHYTFPWPSAMYICCTCAMYMYCMVHTDLYNVHVHCINFHIHTVHSYTFQMVMQESGDWLVGGDVEEPSPQQSLVQQPLSWAGAGIASLMINYLLYVSPFFELSMKLDIGRHTILV